MVYHNLSMSLNHHVPIFYLQSLNGEVFFVFSSRILEKLCYYDGAVALLMAFLQHNCVHRLTRWLWLVLFMSNLATPPRVTSPVLGHVTLLYIDLAP